MPSTNQNNTEDTSYRNEAHEMISKDIDPVPIIRGIDEPERALLYWNECHRCDVSDRVKEMVKIRMQALKES